MDNGGLEVTIIAYFLVYLTLTFLSFYLQNATTVPFFTVGIPALSLTLLTYIIELLRRTRK